VFTIFFSGEKLASLDSSPKGQNMDSYYCCNTLLEGVKATALAGTRKATLRDFHIHMDNCKIHNSKLTKEKLDEIRLIRWDHPPYSPDIAPLDFWFFGWSKREMNGQAFSSREAVKTFLLEMSARMDFGQLFKVSNEWMKRPEYVTESGEEYYTKKTLCFDCLPIRQSREAVNYLSATRYICNDSQTVTLTLVDVELFLLQLSAIGTMVLISQRYDCDSDYF
jgi:histone-lysine N-methyltransferase SETMAR